MQPDYQLIRQLLADAAPSLTPDLVHGAITGYLSSGSTIQTEFFPDLLEAPLPDVVIQLIERLGSETEKQLRGTDFSFHPLLPDDDVELTERLAALSNWCDWFNIGFAAGFMRPQTDMSIELMEVLNDFGQLANVDTLESESSEQDEVNYMELLEYVRMACVTVFQQMNDVEAEQEQSEDLDSSSLFADDDHELH